MNLDRRTFIAAGAASAATAACAAPEEKINDGGLAPVSDPGVPERKLNLVPPGARSFANFTAKCVGCQLCVTACPNGVLRMATGLRHFGRPEMGFEKGWCRPECVACGEVCPAGAIRPITRKEKTTIHIGHAVWHKDACLAAKDGIICTSCQRHCPAQAIVLVLLDPNRKDSPKVPVIDKMKCLGCGACENLCPARPMPGITVKGFERHREVVPMGDADVLGEARRLFETKMAAVVLVKDGVICAAGNGRGLSPLLDMLDSRPTDLCGSWVIDKVIGKAAAAICVAGGAKRVHGTLMCEAAQKLLAAHGIACSADKTVPQILNRDQSGLCPLESAVKDVEGIEAMLAAIRAKLKELSAVKPPAPQTAVPKK